MPQAKHYLTNLYRTHVMGHSRKGFLRLDMNENVEGLPDAFVNRTLSKINTEFLASYPEYETFINKLAHHDRIDPENICISNGSDSAIKYIFEAYISSGDQVLLTDPTFAMYPVYCHMFNACPIMIPYNKDFSFPVDAFLKALPLNIRMAVLVNPNNPTGTAIELPDLRKIINKCAENDVLLIIDEAYFYYYDKTVIEEIKSYDNLIILRTFSKLCALASARIGYAAACPEIIRNLYKVRPTYDVNGLAIYFAEKLLDESELIEKEIEKVRLGKNFFINQLEQNKIEYRDSNANFVLIRCPRFVEEVIDALRKENILVSGGFKQDFLKEYIRVTVGSVQTMRLFCDVFFALWMKLYKTT